MNWAEAPRPDQDPIEPALAAVRERTHFEADVVLVLGSGLRDALPPVDEAAQIGFQDLPGFPEPTVPGHQGTLVLGGCEGVRLAAFCGRIHFYESHRMSACSMTVRLGRALGARTAVVTAAVGGLAPDLRSGSVVALEDHIGLMGVNPLAGWRSGDGGPAFVDLSGVYDAHLREAALLSAGSLGIPSRAGVYAALAGPTYETAAESAFLRGAGADVVGMSMVPETVAAHAVGMRVLGLALVVNAAGTAIDHAEVVAEGHRASDAARGLLAAILPRLT